MVHKNSLIFSICCILASPFSGSTRTNQHRPHGIRPRAQQIQIAVDGTLRPSFQHKGQNFIEGRQAERYTIRIYNRGPTRTEVVVCVDGRDVINGKPCNSTNRGYVVMPWDSLEIEGFRISLEEVAAFRFSDVRDSYAYQMGTPFSVGSINVAFFSEQAFRAKPMPIPFDRRKPERRRGHLPMQQLDNPAYGSGNIGTRFGERKESRATETNFTRRHWSIPDRNLSLLYDDRSGLCNRGLTIFCPNAPLFPEKPPQHDFAKPPPGWEHFYSTD